MANERIDFTTFRDVVQISNEEMDRKEAEHPNLVACRDRFVGIPFYACPDGRTLP